MALIKKNGHAVTSIVGPHADSAQVSPGMPNFMPTQGPANYNGVHGGGGGNFPGSRPSKGQAKSQAQVSPPMGWVPGGGNN